MQDVATAAGLVEFQRRIDGGIDIELEAEIPLQGLGEEDNFIAHGQFCGNQSAKHPVVVGDDGFRGHIECVAGEESCFAQVGQAGVLSGDESFE